MWDMLLIIYVLCILWFIFKDVPLEAALWYHLAKDWQRAARLFGQMGIGAELLYGEAMEKAKL